MSATTLALLAFCIVVETARELCFKYAVDEDEASAQSTGFLRMVATTPLLWLGISLWGMEIIAWVIVLETLPLNVAFPTMSLVYVGVPLASHWWLGERMHTKQWLAAIIITCGVALVGMAG